MLEINFGPFPVITTERLILRHIEESDVSEIRFLRSDERIMQHIDRPRMHTDEEAMTLIQRFHTFEKSGEGINWGITLKGNNTIIGIVGLFNFNKENHRAEFGYLLHPDHHRKGIMREAAQPILEYGFKELRLHSICGQVKPENDASRKVLERSGFVQEAYFKENYFFEGKFLDTVVYSMLTPY